MSVMAEERILVFTKNWLGDVIFEEPFLRALKRTFPTAWIICVTNYRCQDILAANPHVDEIIGFDDRAQDRGVLAKARLARRLREKNIKRAFILHRSFSRALIVRTAGIPERIGYATKGRAFLLTKAVQEPQIPQHRVDYFLHILAASKMYVEAAHGHTYFFYTTDDDKQYVRELLASLAVTPHSYIVINPGANWQPKRWSVAKFAELISKINATYGVPIIITGSQADDVIAEDITVTVEGRKPLSVCGKTSIRQLGALMASAQLVISADSGPLHIASGVGVPVIALFGPTDARMTGPRGTGTGYVIQQVPAGCQIPCFNNACRHYTCMATITADDVLTVINENHLIQRHESQKKEHS